MIPNIELENIETITAYQNEKLWRQLAYLNQNSPFYKRLFKENKINLRKIKTVEDLPNIPVTTKNDLQAFNNDFFCVPSLEIVDYASTSGTTGKPVNFGLTENDLERLAYNEAISFACAGIQKKDIVLLMTTMDRRFMAGLAYFLGLRKIGASIIRTGAGIPALQWEAIINNKPTFLIAVPSFLLKLIQYAENNGINLASTSVKGVICIGEPLRNQDFSPSTLAQKITDKWDIQLFSTYASTEMSTAFTECECQQGGHEHPELIITEVLDAENKPVESGEVGELTVTTLGVEAFPLLRFKTGDLVQMHHEPCACGRNTKRVGPVLGRAQQMIKYKGTTLYPPAIQDVINHFDEISGHLIVLTTNEHGTDEVTVKIVCNHSSPEFLEQLREYFQAKIRVVPTITFINSEEYNRLLIASNSRKPKFVIDNRKH